MTRKAQLAQALRALMEAPIRDKEELRAWYREARKVQDALCRPDEDVPHFHFLMHYLIDADIRRKDPRYAALQNQKLLEVLSELERPPRTA